jgi:hypothetical protein
MELKRKTLGEDAGAEARGKDKAQAREDLTGSTSVGDATNSENKTANAGAGDAHDGAPRRKLTRFRIVLLVCSAALCLLLAAGLSFVKFGTHFTLFPRHFQKLEPVTSIMRPIPVPDYREMLDFLLVYDVGGQRMITAIRMEIAYQSATRYQNFKEQNVSFRDTIYAFLLKQNLPGNSVKTWHSILEKDLLDSLKVRLPKSYPDNILLTQVENL